MEGSNNALTSLDTWGENSCRECIHTFITRSSDFIICTLTSLNHPIRTIPHVLLINYFLMISFYGELFKMMGKLTTSVLVVPGALAVDGEVAELGTVHTRSCSALELILPTTLPVPCIIHHPSFNATHFKQINIFPIV